MRYLNKSKMADKFNCIKNNTKLKLLNIQIKGRDCETGLKKKKNNYQLYALSRRHILDWKVQIY